MEKIQATLILEILGRPAEHIKSALVALVERLGTEKGVTVTAKTIHEPTPVKESKDLFTTFAEVSVEFESIANYFGIIFTYMPANVELISPTEFKISNTELSELGNRLLIQLHNYDAITKKMLFERNFLVKKLREAAPHLFKKDMIRQEEQNPAQEAQPAEEEVEKKKSGKKSKK